MSPAIAERSIFVLDEEVESGIQDVLPQSLPSRLEDDLGKTEPTYCPIDPDSSKFQYELSFDGGVDHQIIQGQINHLRTIVSALSQVLPLRRLDGITIAGDYPAALRNLDRGFDNAPPVETVSPEVGVVVKELVLVGMIEYVERALPGAMVRPIEGKLNDWLYPHVDAALHAYVASYIAAGFNDEQELVEGKRKLLADAINRMRTIVVNERLSYRDHGDLDKLLDVTLPAIGYVLLFAADLLGHNAIAGRSAFQQSDELHISLEQAGLKNWLEAYRVDLMQFHKQLGRWGSFDEFLSFNVHVERLLWQLGMFPWEKPEGIWVEVL